MSAKTIDGKAYAQGLRERLKGEVAEFIDQTGITPGLAVVLVGEDPASQVYVGSKVRQTKEAGMNSFEHRLPVTTSQAELEALIGLPTMFERPNTTAVSPLKSWPNTSATR